MQGDFQSYGIIPQVLYMVSAFQAVRLQPFYIGESYPQIKKYDGVHFSFDLHQM